MTNKPRKAIRTIALTPKGKRAIANMPKLTWDEVMRRSRGTQSQASAPKLGAGPGEGGRGTPQG